MQTSLLSVPYINLSLQHEEIKEELMGAIDSVLRSGQFILGPEVECFEKNFAEDCGVKEAIGLNSGTDALIYALRALGINKDDEVITTANTFVATVHAIVLIGAKPVLVDVQEDLNMDPLALKKALTKRTKAIIPVHLTGKPSSMDPILSIAKENDLWVIEDAAQAVLAQYKGKKVGSFGHIGCFSLHPLKTLSACGDGGIITTNDTQLAEKLRILRNLGLKSRGNAIECSGNSRLDTIQAAILLVKMRYLKEWTEIRREHAKQYQTLLKDIPEIILPKEELNEYAVYHTFVIQANNRNCLKKYLDSHGIGSAIHYPIPVHHQTAYRKLFEGQSFPVAEMQADKILSLPIHQHLTSDQIEYVASKIQQFYRSTR